jgi:hypothetical protein
MDSSNQRRDWKGWRLELEAGRSSIVAHRGSGA